MTDWFPAAVTRGMALVVASASFLVVGCAEEPETVVEPTIRPVRYAEASAGGGARSRTFAGTTQSASEQRLSFSLSGTVQSLALEVGSRVRRGQVLARLDPREYELQRERADAELAQARAQARNAVAEYERVVSLYENNNASRSDLDAARASFESAEAQVTSAQTGLRLAEQDLEDTRLTAPVTGRISSREVEANETVSPGEVVAVLDMAGNSEVAVAVPSAFIAGIQAGQPVQVAVDDVPGQAFDAAVTEVGTPTAGAGTFPVTVRVSSDTDQIRPGMSAEVTFLIEESGASAGRAVIVPPEAVGQDQNGRFLWVLAAAEGDLAVAERRQIEIGSITTEGIEVLSGVAVGELVATAGLGSISEGQPLRLLAP